MRNLLVTTMAAVFALGIGTLKAAEGVAIPSQDWSFSNPFTGKFDRAVKQCAELDGKFRTDPHAGLLAKSLDGDRDAGRYARCLFGV